jgi:hypothetical protein
MLWARDGQAFQERHPNLSSWLVEMNGYVTVDLIHHKANGSNFRSYLADDTLYAEASEQETINHTVEAITALPQLATVREWFQAGTLSSEALRNFASYVAKEETIPTPFNMESVVGPVEQKMLVVSKRKDLPQVSTGTSWPRILSTSPGSSKSIAQ